MGKERETNSTRLVGRVNKRSSTFPDRHRALTQIKYARKNSLEDSVEGMSPGEVSVEDT